MALLAFFSHTIHACIHEGYSGVLLVPMHIFIEEVLYSGFALLLQSNESAKEGACLARIAAVHKHTALVHKASHASAQPNIVCA